MSEAGALGAEDEQEPLVLVLRPVQLAAVLENETITDGDAQGSRWMGGLKMLFGALELVGGAALIVTPEPTMATKVGGSILFVHGADTAAAGSRELVTGRAAPTLTQQAATTAALFAGVRPQRANEIGVAVDILVPLAVSAGLAAARVIAVRQGTIRLIGDEMAGAHTIRRHLYRSDAHLMERMREMTARAAALGRRPPRSISTFESAEVAGRSISRCLSANAARLRDWATRARPGARLDLVLDIGDDIGRGILRDGNAIVRMTKVKVVVERVTDGNRAYFIVTSYPIP